LNVPAQTTGLAQSAAFFQHMQNLPELTEALPQAYLSHLASVGVSVAPRPVEGSYMPVFTAGIAAARILAAAKGIPLFRTTHQEGHIAAALRGNEHLIQEPFLAVHLSGGTTELLHVRARSPGYLRIELLGGTTDLHAGQFVDRVGVRLGLAFPTGKYLEQLALSGSAEAGSWLPSSVQGLRISFSGVETAAVRLLEQGKAQADVARAVEGCIARTLSKWLSAGMRETGRRKILLAGGVAANRFIRQEIERRMQKSERGNMALYWAKPEWCGDNAVGVALLTREADQERSK
jgi:N6-L-threonylcarbamoyladenine synthase